MQFIYWWNLVFELPFLASVLYILVQASGLVGDHDHDFDHDTDHDFDQGIEHTSGQELAHHETGGFVRALEFLGVGRVPLSIVLMLLFGIFGATGFLINLVLESWGIPPAIFFWVSLTASCFTSLTLTRSAGLTLARIMPKYESYSISSVKELLGDEGEAATPITGSYGTALVHDQFGNIHQVRCQIEAGHDSIPIGSRVQLVGFADLDEEVFLVEKTD